jgi:hypothetical protein
MTPQDHIQELEVADGVLLGPEESPQDGAGRIVSGMKKRAGGPLVSEPEMGAAVPLHEKPQLRASRTATAVAGRAAVALGRYPGLTKPAAGCLAADPQPLLREHLDEVGIVELGVTLLMKPQDLFPDLRVEGVMSRLSPVPMGEAACPLGPIPGQQSLGLSVANPQERGSHDQGQLTAAAPLEDVNTLDLT